MQKPYEVEVERLEQGKRRTECRAFEYQFTAESYAKAQFAMGADSACVKQYRPDDSYEVVLTLWTRAR